jgi:hypothetical protein
VMTTEQSDLLLQSLSAAELRKTAATASFKKGGFTGTVEEMAISDEDFMLQNMSLSDLRKMLSLEEKIQQTGLPKERVQQIERDKTQATLAELIQYCKGLKIAYKDFLPELF